MNAPAPPLVVVFNVGAGHGQADAVRATLQAGCAEAGRTLHLLEVHDPQQLSAVARQAVAQARHCGGVVVAAGGDGTINAVAQTALGSGCAFGVLPQGTFNCFSRSHGIPADPHEALQVVLAGHRQPAQVGLMGERVFLVNASLGLYPQLLEERGEWKRQLAAIALRPVGFLKMLGLLWRGAFGRLGDADELLHLAVRQLTVRASRRAGTLGSRRIKVATDGEVTWMRLPLTFRVAAQPLDLLRPPAPLPSDPPAPDPQAAE